MDVREKLTNILTSDSEMLNGLNVSVIKLYRLVDKLIAHGVTVQEWIPVTERIPDWRDGKVLVSTRYGISICERTVNGRWKGQHANWITHWMPLPEPPKGE